MPDKSDRREIVITINTDGGLVGSGGTSSPSEPYTLTANKIIQRSFPMGLGNLARAYGNAGKAHFTQNALATYGAISVVKSTARTITGQVRYNIQRNFQLVDNYVMQRDVDEILHVVSKASSIGGNIIAGAIGGSSLGIPGMIVGATVGAINGIWGQYNAGFQNQDQAQLRLAQTTYNNTYSRNRMGYALTDNGYDTYN